MGGEVTSNKDGAVLVIAAGPIVGASDVAVVVAVDVTAIAIGASEEESDTNTILGTKEDVGVITTAVGELEGLADDGK